MSNINPVKRIEILVKLASRLKDRNIRFHLVGKVWESQKDYNNKIRDIKINKLSNSFFIILETKKITKILLNSDLYLCVSKYESLTYVSLGSNVIFYQFYHQMWEI